ncbi:MAG TPA: trehalase family glycosidase [Bryobacteraceae bacterium]
MMAANAPDCGPLLRIEGFISQTWTALRRANTSPLKAASDDKVAKTGNVIVYVPRDLPAAKIASLLQRQLTPSEIRLVSVLPLPEGVEDVKPGLLYLPHPYVVPGGRFNEMYGWDSYFILRGLLQDGRLTLAKNMTDNLVFEVEHYGKVLNANRTYYLSRSQPPFLTQMVLEVFHRTGDEAWLKGTLPALEKYYDYWTREPHLTPSTELSRYEGGEDTPAPEVLASENDNEGRNDYVRVRQYYRTHTVTAYDVSRFYDRDHDRLTPAFYRADRAMRESGLDPSSRFGPFSVAILDYNPVDLNCLLYRMEQDLASIHSTVRQPALSAVWAARAERRAEAINRLMWDEKAGLYFDYDFVHQRRSNYPMLTAFYPLWTGIASPDRAARVVSHLPEFERAGGLQTSTWQSGDQWDAPFGWAPLHLIANEGLRRYGFHGDADRISAKFLAMVLRDFTEHGTIREKYDVVAARSDLAAGLHFGYGTNEIGFGWTNAAFLVLLHELSPQAREDFRQRCSQGVR